MDMTKLANLSVSAVLLALSAAGARAQVMNTPTLTNEVFFNDNNLLGINSPGASISNTLGGRAQGSINQTAGLGVGFDPNNTFGLFPGSMTAATAQTVYNPFIAQGSAAAGSQFQIGLHGFASSPTGLATEDIDVSIFQFNPNAGNNIPIGPAIVSNVPITFNANVNAGDFLNFSAVTTLTGALTAGQEYVIAFAPATAPNTANPDDFAVVDRIVTSRSNVQDTTGQTMFIADNNSANTGGALAASGVGVFSQQTNGPVAFRLYTGSAPVPEASTVVSFGALLALGGLIAFRRRRSV